MATYCISDIHGYFNEFNELLDKIAFGDSDDLYVLGDIIDRGPKSAEMLIWAVDEAPDNIHFMRGNHEDMAFEVVSHNPFWLQHSKRKTLWTHNGARATVARLKKLTHGDWRANELMPWLASLPVYDKIDVNGKPFLLVHAGVDPDRFAPEDEKPDLNRTAGYKNVRRDSSLLHLSYPPKQPPVHDIGYGFGWQGEDEMLWIREEWYLNPEDVPFDVVHGHTCFGWRDLDRITLAAMHDPCFGTPGAICHYFGKRHCIDCGTSEGRNLGALRLDDFSEFYIPVSN